MKKEYITNFYFTIITEAEDEEKAQEIAIKEYKEIQPTIEELAIETDIKE